MRLLRASFDHLKMFENGEFTIDFYAQDRVLPEDDSVTRWDKAIATNNVVAIAGINASGKSIALSLIDLALRMLEGRPIGLAGAMRALSGAFGGDTNFSALLWHKGSLLLLKSHIVSDRKFLDVNTAASELEFGEEVLYRITVPYMSKTLLTLSDDELISGAREEMRRSMLDKENARFLQKDASMMAAFSEKEPAHLYLEAADIPLALEQGSDGVDAILRTFDSSIEHLEVKDGGRAFELKLSTSDEPLTLSRDGLEDILSSGTLKGLSIIQRAIMVLRNGGFLLLDEIENHLNRQLVNVIIDLFAARSTNPHGATLVFTTHYPEILDHIHRKDNVYFLTRGASNRSTAVKYCSKVKRIENKKSEVFISNFVNGTAPRYTDVTALREYTRKAVGGVCE